MTSFLHIMYATDLKEFYNIIVSTPWPLLCHGVEMFRFTIQFQQKTTPRHTHYTATEWRCSEHIFKYLVHHNLKSFLMVHYLVSHGPVQQSLYPTFTRNANKFPRLSNSISPLLSMRSMFIFLPFSFYLLYFFFS